MSTYVDQFKKLHAAQTKLVGYTDADLSDQGLLGMKARLLANARAAVLIPAATDTDAIRDAILAARQPRNADVLRGFQYATSITN